MKMININKIPWKERKSPRGTFHFFYRDVARQFEGRKNGPKLPSQPPFEFECVRISPGASNYPFHSHAAEWEFYFIVSGTGTMRAGNIRRKIRPGDCLLCPPGEPHRMTNTGKVDLVYYVVANNAGCDVWHYPDSNKWGFWASFMDRGKIFRFSEANYYHGEE